METKPTSDRDHQVLDELHQNLAEQGIIPEKHLVDTAYINAQLLVHSSQKYNVDLIGPAPGDSQWQSRAQKGFGLADFEIDWSQQVVRCPHDKLSSSWTNRLNLYSQPVVVVKFKKSDCHNCPSRLDCTKDKTGVRTLTLRPQELHEALNEARARQQTPEFKEQYAKRCGVEGTISQATRLFGLRRCRYRGFEKTRLQHIITAAAMNFVRVWQWWTQANNFGKSISRFAALAV